MSVDLQLSAGARRQAGQEGYPWIRLPKQGIQRLRSLFGENDSRGLETMAFLFGVQAPSGAATVLHAYNITDVVIVEHTSSCTACQMTRDGSDQLARYMQTHVHKVLLGWAHSHHQVQLVPQGRLPSQQDIDTQYTLQRQFPPAANLMLIMNEVGFTCWTLPHTVMQLMHNTNGECSRVDDHPNNLVANACFVTFQRDAQVEVDAHPLGHSIAPGPGRPQRVCGRCATPWAALARFCGACGIAESESQSIRRACSVCHVTLSPEAKFCGECGAPVSTRITCTLCSSPLSAAARFCGSCGTAVAPPHAPTTSTREGAVAIPSDTQC